MGFDPKRMYDKATSSNYVPSKRSGYTPKGMARCEVCGKLVKEGAGVCDRCRRGSDPDKLSGPVKVERFEPTKFVVLKLRKCPVCGKEFAPKNPNHKYCSKPCTDTGVAERRKQRGK